MKASLLAGVSLAAIVTASAQADDLAKRKGTDAYAAVPAIYNWTGFYVGANIGGIRGKSRIDDVGPINFLPGSSNIDDTSVIGGFQAGYNWQYLNLVLGIEADIGFTSNNQSKDAAFGVTTARSHFDIMSTVRGRVGYAFDRTLIYATGGAAFSDWKGSIAGGPVAGADRRADIGWVAGVGVEYAIQRNWTVKVEYLHADFGSENVNDSAGTGYVFRFKERADTVRLGVNFRF